MARKRKYNDMFERVVKVIDAPKLAYEPPQPKAYNPPIALIGCGGISRSHLSAYREMGLNVVAVCDLIEGRARSRRDEFCPDAEVYTDYKKVLKRDDIEVVDLATHPQERDYLIPEALRARKHVLSQKPFVMDLNRGEIFAELADKMGVKLAINHNGRWSPHWSWCRYAVEKGLIGGVLSAHFSCHWDHEWIANTHFNRLHHIILYDYAIHWFDAITSMTPGLTPLKVHARLAYARGQVSKPPLLAQVMIEFDHGLGGLHFNAKTLFGGQDHGVVIGTAGAVKYSGPSLATHDVELINKRGKATPKLSGTWFKEGFMGTMGELLSAIEAKRVPANNANANLRGLAVCFAAIVSAETGKPQLVGKIRKAPVKTCMVAPE